MRKKIEQDCSTKSSRWNHLPRSNRNVSFEPCILTPSQMRFPLAATPLKCESLGMSVSKSSNIFSSQLQKAMVNVESAKWPFKTYHKHCVFFNSMPTKTISFSSLVNEARQFKHKKITLKNLCDAAVKPTNGRYATQCVLLCVAGYYCRAAVKMQMLNFRMYSILQHVIDWNLHRRCSSKHLFRHCVLSINECNVKCLLVFLSFNMRSSCLNA